MSDIVQSKSKQKVKAKQQANTKEKNDNSLTKATVYGFIRQNIELDGINRIVPDEIIMICYDYYGHDFISSSILNVQERDQLFRLLMTQKTNLIPGTTRLIYNASKHGFNAESFYAKCNGLTPSILIIKSNWGKKFGAFTQIAWDYDSAYHAEHNVHDTFLYSLNNHKNGNSNNNGRIFKIKRRDLEYAVYHGGNGARDLDSDLIFYFGAAAGLLLYENCNVRDDNFAYGGEKCGYQIPKGNMLCGGCRINTHYSDKYEFRVENFEIFTVDLEENTVINPVTNNDTDDTDDEYDDSDEDEDEEDDDDDDDE